MIFRINMNRVNHGHPVILCYNFDRSLNLTHPTVTGMLTLKRWIGFALVVFILYGTTVEAAHRHGRILPTSGVDLVANPEHTNSPASGITSCGDCLICQLHQNFNTTPVAFRFVDPPVSIIPRFISALPRDVFSQATGVIAGRAPPFLS